MSDNLTTPVPAATVLATKDLGTRQLPLNGILDQAGADAVGLVTTSPAANTILGRLKDIVSALIAGPKTGATSLSVVPNSDGFAVTVVGVSTEATLAAASAKLPASLGAKAGSASFSIVPASDASFAITSATMATAANQETIIASLAAIAASVNAAKPAPVYVPIALGSSNLTNGACTAIVAEVAGRVNLKQPDGTARANYPLQAGLNPIEALVIDAPTSGSAANGVWALYNS